MSDNFILRWGAPLAEQYDDAPEDPLDELTATEFGLRRFCYDLNCEIRVVVGAREQTAWLYPDISMAVVHLPGVIVKVASGEGVELDFSDLNLDLTFAPSPDGITCTLRQYGSEVWETKAEASQEQVLHELTHFYRGVIEQAVAFGYVEAPEGQRLLAELPEAE